VEDSKIFNIAHNSNSSFGIDKRATDFHKSADMNLDIMETITPSLEMVEIIINSAFEELKSTKILFS